MVTELTQSKPHERRWTFRLSIRGLIALVLVIGGSLGWLGYRARVQRQAVGAVERAGGKVFYDFQDLRVKDKLAWVWPKWLVDAVGVDYLANVTTVQDDFTGQGLGLTDADMAAVGRLDRLETLVLVGRSSVTDAGFVHLRGLPRLKRLDLLLGGVMSGATLAHVAGLTRLEQLQFTTPRVTDADLAHLSGLVHLRTLSLSLDKTSGVTDAGLAHLEPLLELESLQIDGAKKLTNAGLAHLGKLNRLEHLGLTNAPITNLEALGPLASLNSLSLMGDSVDDAGLAAVSRLTSLREIFLPGSITDAGLVHLRSLPALVGVHLGPGITDAGMSTLAECPNLKHVFLAGAQIGDAGLAKLDNLKKLALVDLTWTGVTPAGVQAAVAAHPGLKVIGPTLKPGLGFQGSITVY